MSTLFGLGVGLLLGAGVGVVASRVIVRRAVGRVRVAERRARTAERLAEIGSMTGGLAHEIKNPLSTIGLNAQLLGEAIADLPIEHSDRERLTRRIGALRREVDRLRDILEGFLRFAGAPFEELVDGVHALTVARRAGDLSSGADVEPLLAEHLLEQPVRAAVHVVAADHVIALLEQVHHGGRADDDAWNARNAHAPRDPAFPVKLAAIENVRQTDLQMRVVGDHRLA